MADLLSGGIDPIDSGYSMDDAVDDSDHSSSDKIAGHHSDKADQDKEDQQSKPDRDDLDVSSEPRDAVIQSTPFDHSQQESTGAPIDQVDQPGHDPDCQDDGSQNQEAGEEVSTEASEIGRFPLLLFERALHEVVCNLFGGLA